MMIRVSAKKPSDLFSRELSIKGIALEARIYGDSPLQEFAITWAAPRSYISKRGSVDTWVKPGTIVSSYDPLLAKIIVSGNDRPEAVRNLLAALEGTTLSGIETNLEYLKAVVSSDYFQNGTYRTTSLDNFEFSLPAVEVLSQDL